MYIFEQSRRSIIKSDAGAERIGRSPRDFYFIHDQATTAKKRKHDLVHYKGPQLLNLNYVYARVYIRYGAVFTLIHREI
jgi:hypothetical protein